MSFDRNGFKWLSFGSFPRLVHCLPGHSPEIPPPHASLQTSPIDWATVMAAPTCTTQRSAMSGAETAEVEVNRVARTTPNPPVNTDACGRAAMHVGYRARAGYRERYASG